MAVPISPPSTARSSKPVAPTPESAADIHSAKSFDKAARRLDAISDPVSLQILWWLGRGDWSVTDLCSLVGMRQQAVTLHLGILRLEGLAGLHRRDRCNFYRITEVGRAALAVAKVLMRQGRDPAYPPTR